MNILFIEDELDLQASGVLQLEMKGHQVFPTNDLAESRAILSDESTKIDLIISDHSLPDGLGIQFVLEIREQFPDCRCAIVSGCLSDKDIETLEAHGICYYRKPLLYARVIEEMRSKPSISAPVNVEEEAKSEPEAEPEEAPVQEAHKKKNRFGFWPRR